MFAFNTCFSTSAASGVRDTETRAPWELQSRTVCSWPVAALAVLVTALAEAVGTGPALESVATVATCSALAAPAASACESTSDLHRSEFGRLIALGIA